MKAIVMTALGGPEVLQLADLPQPAPGPNQLLVRVHAAGVNPLDYKLRKTGAMGYGPGKVLGFDAAGIVEAIGPGVTAFQPGDRVFYSPDTSSNGSYAQYHVANADIVAPMPPGLSFEQAAAIPLAGMTACDGLFLRAHLALGQTVLITSANGGVGSLALQLAKAAGAFVYATCSSRSEDFVKNIPTAVGKGGRGPDRLLNYQTQDWSAIIKSECPDGLDLAYDCTGQDVVSRSIPLMKPYGHIVSIVNPAGNLAEGYRHNVSLHYEFMIRRRSTLDFLSTLLQRRQLTPLIDSVLPLEQAAEAHRRLEAGGVKGKIVLRVT
jgi:NADPH:quinone reductase